MIKKIILIIAILIAVISLPYIIDWLISQNLFPIIFPEAQWMPKWGGYIGAAISSLISLAGIMLTIKYTQEENHAERELQLRPVFDLIHHTGPQHINEEAYSEYFLGFIVVYCKNEKDEDIERIGSALLTFRNVGNGPAVNIDFTVTPKDTGRIEGGYFHTSNDLVTTNSVIPGKQSVVEIDVFRNKKATRNNDVHSNIQYFYPPKDIVIVTMNYDDLLGNHFSQRLKFEISYYISDGTEASYKCDIHLKEKSIPKKQKRKKPS